MSDYIDFSDDVGSSESEQWRGEEGVTDRLSLCWFKEDEDGNYLMSEGDSPKFKRTKYHYIEGKGYVQSNSYLREKEGNPKNRVGTFVVEYRTDDNGNLNKSGADSIADIITVKRWEFGQDKFQDLKSLHNQWPLTQNDFTVTCKDEQFQRLNIQPCPDGAIWQKDDDVREMVLSRVEEQEDSLSLARELPEEELREHYGDVEDVELSDSADDDLDDLMGDIE